MSMNHLELFAGIGGFRTALKHLSDDYHISINNVGFSEIDRYASKTYKANYATEDEIEIGDIVKFNSVPENISTLPNIDLLSGGFPCQSFSMMGKQLGFSEPRGNMFFEIMKILKVKRPAFVILENVRNLVTHDEGRTFATIRRYLENEGYHVFFDIFNTADFSLAQKRKRVYIFATLKNLDASFKFSTDLIVESFNKIVCNTSLLKQKTTRDVLASNVDSKYYLSSRIKPTILADGAKGYRSRSTINPVIAKPLTATMAKMHRACQDNYFSDSYICGNAFDYNNYSKQELCNLNIRKLTPSEALALQGFDYDFYLNARNAGLSDVQLYKQAGNAVSVNTVYAILYYLFVKCGVQK